MFGYLLPEKQELKVRDLALYRAAYCGVCRALKLRYGEASRFTVSYDAAVLAVLLIGASGVEPKARSRRCALNMVQRKLVLEGHEALRYAAAASVLLAWRKLRDAWADDRNLAAPPALAALARANRRAERDWPALASHIDACLMDLDKLEKAGCAEIDRPADSFGNLYSGVLTGGPALDSASTVLLRSMGYHLGRWIYLIDALDDYEKDRKSGSYNPILAMCGGKSAVELAGKACLFASGQAAAVFDLLEFRWGREIIENVLCSGMPRVFDKVTNKEKSADDDRPVEGAWSPAGLKR